MKKLTFNANELIFRQGDDAKVMYDILSGRVGVYTDYQTAQEKEIAVLDSGNTVGEMGMIELWPRSATAVALEDGTVLAEIGESELRDYFAGKPEKLLAIMKQLSRSLRETTQKYVDVCRTVSEREREEDLQRRLDIQKQMESYSSFYMSTWMH